MVLRLVLTDPPQSYDQRYEIIRNREIQRIVDGKASADTVGNFAGLPLNAAVGTNAAYASPAAVTKVPFNTASAYTTDDVSSFDTTNNNFTILAPALYNVKAYLNAPATVIGGATVFTVSLYKNAALFDERLVSLPAKTGLYVPAEFMISAALNDVLDIRLANNSGGAINFDLTLSAVYLYRLSLVDRVV